MNEIIIFEENELKLEVNLDVEGDTVWLTQIQLAELFQTSRNNITMHILNCYKDGELEEDSTSKDFLLVQKEGKREIGRNTKHYNLDMIISIGYRVNSKRGIIFRRWATSILKQYMLKGYAENKERLSKLEKTLQLVDIASRIDSELSSDESKKIFNIINNYGKTIKLLDDYDHKKIEKQKGNIESVRITYEECIELIDKMKTNFDSKLFGRERENTFRSCVETIYQTYDGTDLYSSIEEKASNLLYLIVKDHTFIDGNKRIGALMFLYYLDKNNYLYRDNKKVIDDNTLVALTLLIAGSNPKEKDILIDLITNFLVI